MVTGTHFLANQKRTNLLTEKDWELALQLCKEHLKWRLKKRTLSGVFSSGNLGVEAMDHYLGLAYEKILLGEWEWKVQFSLGEQMIRIIDSSMSKEVEKKDAGSAHLSHFIYPGDELEFYNEESTEERPVDEAVNKFKLEIVEKACKGDGQLEFIIEALKEGKKRAEIATLLEIQPRQFDKLREKLLSRIDFSQI